MPKLQLRLQPSKSFFIIMLFILSGALVSIFCSDLPYYIQLLLAAAALVYGGRLIWGTVLLREKRAVVLLTCQDDNTWLLTERSGREYSADLCGDSTRFPGLNILRFKQSSQEGCLGKRRDTVVFYDSVDPDCYRRLQMRLGSLYAIS